MGRPLYKGTNSINTVNISKKLKEIEERNGELLFKTGNHVPVELIPSFIDTQNKLRTHLLEKYNEDIDTYSVNRMQNFINGTDPQKKKFSYIYNESENKIIGRLDACLLNNEIEIESLFIEEEFRKNGFGYWLLGSLMLQTYEVFPQAVFFKTSTNDDNDDALNLLNKFDFFFKTTIPHFILSRNEQLK